MSLPYLSPYHASKFALEGIGDALRMEMSQFGVGVSIVEPGSIATPFWNKGRDQVEDVLGSMSPEQRDLYAPSVEGALEGARKAEERGIEPDRVAKAVEHALTASRPKTRYLVGTDARAQALLRRFLPDRVMDRLVASQMK